MKISMRSLPLLTAALLILPAHADISAVRNGDNLKVEIDGKLFTEYRADKWIPCLYPLMSPDGTHLTRRFPFEKGVDGEENDHPHHVGSWFAHGSVNGSDYWHGGNDGSKIVTKGFVGEPEVAKSDTANPEISFAVDLEWIGSDGKRDLTERRTYAIRSAGTTRVIDVTSDFRATDGDVAFGDTKEGSFAIRVAPTIRHRGEVAKGGITNSEGGKGDDAWGKRAKWVAFHGPDSAGTPTVIAILDHRENLRHPTWWHARDYGLLAANPFGHGSFKDKQPEAEEFVLKNGESLTQRYRLVLHQGDLESADLEDLWTEFSK